MDIIIRNLDKSYVKSIDETAKKHNMSRNEFLKIYLIEYAQYREMQTYEDQLESLVKINQDTMLRCSVALKKMTDFLNELSGEGEEM